MHTDAQSANRSAHTPGGAGVIGVVGMLIGLAGAAATWGLARVGGAEVLTGPAGGLVVGLTLTGAAGGVAGVIGVAGAGVAVGKAGLLGT